MPILKVSSCAAAGPDRPAASAMAASARQLLDIIVFMVSSLKVSSPDLLPDLLLYADCRIIGRRPAIPLPPRNRLRWDIRFHWPGFLPESCAPPPEIRYRSSGTGG